MPPSSSVLCCIACVFLPSLFSFWAFLDTAILSYPPVQFSGTIINKTNSKLIQECAALLGESIQRIKKEDLLTVDFLSMLPIRKDDIPSLFLPLYDQTLQVLKRYRLLPTTDGTFASATQVKLARGADLRELINERQLSTLYGAPTPLHWLTSDITFDKTRDLYIYINKELEVDIVDPEVFV